MNFNCVVYDGILNKYVYSIPTICNAKVSHNFFSVAKLLKTNLMVGSCLCEIYTSATTRFILI